MYEQTRRTFNVVPFFLLNLFLKVLSFFSYTLNLDLRKLGVPQDPFGSAMITNIGTLGLDVAYVPLVPYSRVPILLALGGVKDVPVVDGGQIRVGKIMTVNATFDHRIIDGFHAASMSKTMRAWMERPYQHFDRLGELPEVAAVSP